MELKDLYAIYTQYPIVTTDTRNCIKDSIFFALKGSNFNGNEYAKKALELGCKYAIIDEPEFVDNSENIILVDDCLKTLQLLARYHRDQFKIPVIGITGTNGKTTTKELITAVLSEEFKVLSTEGNLNNHIGVPLTLLRLNQQHEIAIIEMGANHVGEIAMLAHIANPNFGLITNVGKAHIEGFGSFANIVKTKGELYDFIRNRHEGKVFVDYDNPYLIEMSQDLTSIYYGLEDDLFVTGRVENNTPYLSFSWKFSQNYHIVHSNLIGEYNLPNILASVAVGKYFGVKTQKIIQAIEGYNPTNLRSQLRKTDRNTLIVDTYNANPTSMNAALSNFSKMNVDNKVLILGDMLELGAEAGMEHQKIVDLIEQNNIGEAYLIGEHFYDTKTSFQKYKTLPSFEEFLRENTFSDKFILIKGSRGLKLERCIDLL